MSMKLLKSSSLLSSLMSHLFPLDTTLTSLFLHQFLHHTCCRCTLQVLEKLRARLAACGSLFLHVVVRKMGRLVFWTLPCCYMNRVFKASPGQAREERPNRSLLWSLARCFETVACVGKGERNTASLREHAP
jgi:hypothetical protein